MSIFSTDRTANLPSVIIVRRWDYTFWNDKMKRFSATFVPPSSKVANIDSLAFFVCIYLTTAERIESRSHTHNTRRVQTRHAVGWLEKV